MLVNTNPLGIQSKGNKCSMPAEMQCIHFRFGDISLILEVGKFHETKISDFDIDESKLFSSQSIKISTFFLIPGNFSSALSK